MIGAELSGDAGRTWVTLPVDDQRGDQQGGKLLRQGALLGEAIRVVAKELIDSIRALARASHADSSAVVSVFGFSP